MLNKSMYARIKNCQRGAVIVLFALMLPVLFGFMGLGIDVGLAYVEKGKVQDIADSAALAGAAHLADEGDRLAAIQAAVKEYVEANGITLGKNGMLLKATNESWDEKETLAAGQDALVAYGIVTFADGETPDRVRVRVTKRIPSFFVNVIGDFSDGFTVVAKAAAEGEGEEIEITAEGPGIVAFGNLNFFTDKIHDRNDKSNAKGYGSDIYFGGTFSMKDKNGKLMLSGDYYAHEEVDDKVLMGKSNGGGNKGQFRDIDTNNDPVIESVNKNVENLEKECKKFAEGSGEAGFKYITNCAIKNDKGQNIAVIDNSFFSGSSKIDNLVINIPDIDAVVLQTDGLSFGNIYVNSKTYVEGTNNAFSGRLYSKQELNVYGSGNTYTQLLSDTLNIGKGFDGDAGNNKGKKWDVYFNEIKNTFTDGSGSGSGGSGSGSSGSTTTGKLRLVE